MTPTEHTERVINTVSTKTDRVILFYSTGKDSIALLDIIAPHFKEIHLVFMYFVKDLEHINKYLRFCKSTYPNIIIHQVPHWNLTYAIRSGLYCVPNPNVKLMTVKDVDQSIRLKTGIQYSFYGMKQSDGLNRRLMLRGYEQEAISTTNRVYPLSRWKKADVMAYIRQHKLPEPIAYSTQKKSQGLTFDAEVFGYLRANYPCDLEKIYRAFPLSKQILLKYDNTRKTETQ